MYLTRKLFLFFVCISFLCLSRAQNDVNSDPISTEDINSILSTILPTVESSTPQQNGFSSEISANSVTESSSSVMTTTEMETTTLSVLQKWQKFEKMTKVFAKNSIKNVMAGLIEGSGNLNVSASCRRDVLKLLIGLRDIKTWAFSFIDASGKIIDGMLQGTMSSLGEYDQCVNTTAVDDKRGKNFGKAMFVGQYCAIDVKPPLPAKRNYYKLNEPLEELREFSKGGNVINEAAKTAQFFQFLSMRYGICVPSGCSPADIQEALNSLTKENYINATVKRCELKQDYEYTPLIIGVMTAMCFFGFMMLVGSLIDMYHYYAEKKIASMPLQILVCFSLISNFKKFVNTKTASDKLSCLHGFRFLSITWIILAHTYLNINFQLFRGLRKAIIIQQDPFFQAVVNASVAVDTFFFMGGLLVCYVTVNVIRETKKPFNIPVYIVHRLFRLYPVYIMVIIFIFLAPILGSGPIYQDLTENFVNDCKNNWWTNLLFINNFVRADHLCLPQSWYVSCDMQLYIAALIVIIPILKYPRVGLSIAFLGMLASVIANGVTTYVNEYPPTMLFVHPDPDQRIQYWANMYFKPFSHAGPYCIGLMVGYLLATKPNLKFSLLTRFIGWCSAIACNLAVLYGVYEWNIGRDPELVETLLYSSLHRVAWTLGVAWVVVNCATGQGGVVNYILSWKCFIPLGRLTYCAYLIHPVVQISAVANVRMKLQAAHFFAVWMFFGHLMITYGCSFATSMLVEAPFLSLEKIILRKLGPKREEEVPKTELTDGEETEAKRTENGHTRLNGAVENGSVSRL
ncbi:nose resistant to fluoxetine protein 6-like [Argiope bruennichi]|uniref:nose resistant to fluoxetine protein 6-like n=1 Tax=Argiope bruennichi TaxID=94029 RepID=UPI0024947802|nr:nose resistant to fluoxetine protein 6-like [Argiope bruennichi]